jgi:hypothetical protein
MSRTLSRLTGLADSHAVAAVIAAVAVAAALFVLWQAASRAVKSGGRVIKGHAAEDVLTLVAAGIATAVAMTGMWKFFGVVLHFDGPLRGLLFAFIELSVITSAVRAKRNMREIQTAGIDGAAMWALTGLSAVLSSLAARSAAEAVFRLSAPLVAAWLWHRGLALEKRRTTGRVIHWRVTTERVLVRLGLAEPTGRDIGDVAADRRLTQLARAAARLRVRRADGAWSWRQAWARRRLRAAMEHAVEHAALASDPSRKDDLLALMGALSGADALAKLDPPAPWEALLGDRERAAGKHSRSVSEGVHGNALVRAHEGADEGAPPGAPVRTPQVLSEGAHQLLPSAPATVPDAPIGAGSTVTGDRAHMNGAHPAGAHRGADDGAHGGADDGAHGGADETALVSAPETAHGGAHQPADKLRTEVRTNRPRRAATRRTNRPTATIRDAENEFMLELAAGELPSQRQIMSRLHVGPDRAKILLAHLENLSQSRSTP